MKNQYFGDKRDLFKYDLALRVCQKLGLGFTFIPMLTAPDGRTDGNQIDYKKAKAGYDNLALCAILSRCVERNHRDVRQLIRFFARTNVRLFLYQPKERYFIHSQRTTYFQDIRDEYLKHALILLDPDNGLQIKRSKERHLLFKEVKTLFEKMGGSSCLMVYQHFPREEHTAYLAKRVEQLHTLLDSPIYWISDNEIIFFFAGKTKATQDGLLKVLRQYKVDYPQLLMKTPQ